MSNSMNEENAGFTISVDYAGHQALVEALVNVVGRTASLVTLALIEMERLERKSGMLTADGWFVFTLRHVCKATGLRPRQVRSALRRMAKEKLIALKRQGAAGWYLARLLDDPPFVQN